MSNLMDILTGGGDPNKRSLLGFIGDLPGLLSPGSGGPIAAPGEETLDPAAQAALKQQYQQRYAADRWAAIGHGANHFGATSAAGADAQDAHNEGVAKALTISDALAKRRTEMSRNSRLQSMIDDPNSPLNPAQRQALSVSDPAEAAKELATQAFAKAPSPMSGTGGLWINKGGNWVFQKQPSNGGIPESAHWDEKRGGFAWADSSGPHFQTVPGVKPNEGEDGKPQYIQVSTPDGKLQGMWVKPGQPESMGVPVGAPKDPTSGVAGGGRARIQIGRMLLAGDQVAHSAENIMRIPVTADTGFLGTGGGHTSIFGIGIQALNNKVSSQDSQTYRVLQSGLSRNLAGIEAAGLAPAGSLTGAMDSVIFAMNDNQITKLNKLAEVRQIADVGLDYVLSSPDVSAEQKQHVMKIKDRLKKAIPFTQAQVLQLQYNDNKDYTLNDAMRDVPAEDDGSPDSPDTTQPPPS